MSKYHIVGNHMSRLNYHKCEGWIEKSVPRITECHHEACRMMTTCDRERRFFYPTLTRIILEYLLLLTFKYRILYWKNMKKSFQKILNSLRCDAVTSFQHYNDGTDRRAASVRPTYDCCFIFPTD